MSAESRKKAIQGMVQKDGSASPKARRSEAERFGELSAPWTRRRRRRRPYRGDQNYPDGPSQGPHIRLT